MHYPFKEKHNKLIKLLWKILLNKFIKGAYEHNWIKYIRDILLSTGCLDMQTIDQLKSVKQATSQTLSDQWFQEWNAKTNISSKGKTTFFSNKT